MSPFPSSRFPHPHPHPTQFGVPVLSRRGLLRGAAVGTGALGLSGLLSACGERPADENTVTFGSNQSDPVPREALAQVVATFEEESDLTVEVNTVDHNTFQENINRYLQGTPDDVFTWFAGYRMQFFAAQGLLTPISDVWEDIGDQYSDAMRDQSTGEDGEQYFVPFYYYPWAMFYRPSVWAERGYTPPTTFDEYIALCDRMRADGLVPIAFGNEDGWPAMGTFDYLNMRINGYEFHAALMRGEESWEDPAVREVFATWAELLPYCQEGANGRIWQDAAQALVNGEAGMYLLGMFVGQQFPDDQRDDLDFFPFPEINPEHGQGAVEAPIDGFLISAEARNVDGAKELLRFLASAEAQELYLASDPNNIAANSTADTSNYSAMQNKAVELVSNATHISQFMDRDTRPDFASTVMIPSLQQFINDPSDIDGLLRQIEEQKQSIFDDE